jgi:hypothetical protein
MWLGWPGYFPNGPEIVWVSSKLAPTPTFVAEPGDEPPFRSIAHHGTFRRPGVRWASGRLWLDWMSNDPSGPE